MSWTKRKYGSCSLMKKKGQVTLFIILSVIIVIAVVSFFILRPSFLTGSNIISNPESYLEKCAQDSIKKTEDLLIKNNLNLNQNFTNFYLYKSEKVPYLCTTQEFYVSCVPQEPGLFANIQKILENRALIDVQNCFNNLKKEFSSKGYLVEEGSLSLDLKLTEKSVSILLSKKFIAKQEENSFSIQDLEFEQPSSLYGLIKTTQAIVNYESTVCEFNEMNWMRAMHDILISKFVGSDGTKVYTLLDKLSEKSIKFAVKSCPLPAGI